MGDGDGWTVCSLGHRHWGRFGAAGLLIRDDHGSVLLQHRAPWTHEGGTWAVPGGARDSDEDPITTALREAREEAELDGRAVRPTGWLRDDHGGWSYTTVTAHAPAGLAAHAANAESSEIRWWAEEQVTGLPLHAGFAAAWPLLRLPPPSLHLIVDVANVMGARPNGWWRDRRAAASRILTHLGALAQAGIAAPDLAGLVDPGRFDGLYPRITAVLEGAARGATPGQPSAGLSVVDAEHDGDSAVVELTRADPGVVVTADRGLRAALDARCVSIGPGWLWPLLDATGGPSRA